MLKGPTAAEVAQEITTLDESTKRKLKALRALLKVLREQEGTGEEEAKPDAK